MIWLLLRLLATLWGGLALLTGLTPALSMGARPMLVEYVQFQSNLRDLDYIYVSLEETRVVRLRRPYVAPSPPYTSQLPDGRTVITRSTPGNIDLFLQTSADAPLTQLTRFSDFPTRASGRDARRANVMPLWSPDQNWVMFVSADEVGRAEVYALRSDGSDLRRLVERLSLTTRNPRRPRWLSVPARLPDESGALAALLAGAALGWGLWNRRGRMSA